MVRKLLFQGILSTLGITLLVSRSLALPDTQTDMPKWVMATVSLNGKNMTFVDGVAALAAQIKHLIIADGEPISVTANWDLHDSAKAVLDRFCARYDYDWTINSRGAILMRKRFFVPEDLPQMHRAEMKETSRDVLTALSSLPSEPDPVRLTALGRAIYDSLTADQLTYLRAKVDKAVAPYGNGLPFQRLYPMQMQLVSQYVDSYTLGSLTENWRKIDMALEALPDSVLHCTAQDPTGDINVSLDFNHDGHMSFPILQATPKAASK